MPRSPGLDRSGLRAKASRLARRTLTEMLADLTGTSEAEWNISPPDGSSPRVVAHPAGIEPPHVSLSHDDHLAACCVRWMGPVGIDIQHDRPADRLSAIGSFLGWPTELQDNADGSTLTRAWAVWEACAKASGHSALGPVPEFAECLDAIDRPDGPRWCISERVGLAWLVVASPDLGVRHPRVSRWSREPG